VLPLLPVLLAPLSQTVLVSSGIELIFFPVAGIVLGFGFRMRITMF